MRFQCVVCGAIFEHPMNLRIGGLQITNNDTGEVTRVPLGRFETACVRCGMKAIAINQHVVRDSEGREILGFADTPAGLAALRDALADLRALDETATAEQIAQTIERADPALRPVADYVRKHHRELAGLGLSLLAVVISLLAWLYPRGQDAEPQQMPPGITERDLERLVIEIQHGASTAPADADRASHRHADGNKRQRNGTSAGGENTQKRHHAGTNGEASAP